jgi:type VI secretion system secreted protein VgrG
MKELAGGASASAAAPQLAKDKGLFNEAFTVKDEDSGQLMPHVRYRIEDTQGNVLASGLTDAEGRTARVHSSQSDQIRLFLLD